MTAPAASAAPANLADDFDGDGYRDFVMLGGSHGKDGQFTVVYGTSSGPGIRAQTIHQDSAGIPGAVEAEDGWGSAATTADLDRDGYWSKSPMARMSPLWWPPSSGTRSKVCPARLTLTLSGYRNRRWSKPALRLCEVITAVTSGGSRLGCIGDRPLPAQMVLGGQKDALPKCARSEAPFVASLSDTVAVPPPCRPGAGLLAAGPMVTHLSPGLATNGHRLTRQQDGRKNYHTSRPV
ncbi:hypothetical protein SUDANB1_00074 [Streptomyces sp. enrichment culture]|uniref:FG-GAP repeat domain-containing protein n=1 Tax=Streptomyces sp. enrichment culture TaxID=1795815 RepID=UPI003F563E4F